MPNFFPGHQSHHQFFYNRRRKIVNAKFFAHFLIQNNFKQFPFFTPTKLFNHGNWAAGFEECNEVKELASGGIFRRWHFFALRFAPFSSLQILFDEAEKHGNCLGVPCKADCQNAVKCVGISRNL